MQKNKVVRDNCLSSGSNLSMGKIYDSLAWANNGANESTKKNCLGEWKFNNVNHKAQITPALNKAK